MDLIYTVMNFIKNLKAMDWVLILTILGAIAVWMNNRSSSEKSTNTKEKVEEIYEYQTGGDSYGEILIDPYNNEEANYYFHNLGDQPMWGINVRIIDPMEMTTSNPTEADLRRVGEYMRLIEVGDIAGKIKKPLGILKRNFNVKNKIFFIDINSRNEKNKEIHQETRLTREPTIINGTRAMPDTWYFQTTLSKDGKIFYRNTNAPKGYNPKD